jgi:hypothetical protein
LKVIIEDNGNYLVHIIKGAQAISRLRSLFELQSCGDWDWISIT